MKRSGWKGGMTGMLGGALGTLVLNALQQAYLSATSAAESKSIWNRGYARQQNELFRQFEQAHIRTAAVVAGFAGLHVSPS